MTLVVSPDQMPDWLRKKAGMLREIEMQLVRGLETSGQGLSLDHLQAVIEHRNPFKTRAYTRRRPGILALIQEGDAIEAVDGTETIAQAKDVFLGYLDPKFVAWDLDKPGKATKREVVSVYEMREDATFASMFGSLVEDVRNLVLTQHQIRSFCAVNRRGRFHNDGRATYFLFEEYNELFVAEVNVHGEQLEVCVDRFGRSSMMFAGHYSCRVVVPKIPRLL